MLSVQSFLRRRGADILATVFILVCVVSLAGPVVHAGLDRNQRCVSNLGRIVTALSLYMTDYDEVVPYDGAMKDYATFQQVIFPYTKDMTVFRCPATRNSPYRPNAAIATRKLASFDNLDTTEIIRDSTAHPDGKSTVGFTDGHVERGGVDQTLPLPDVTCRVRERRILNGLQMYAQDYDGVFPFHGQDTDFRGALQPYVRSERTWRCPDSKQFFVLSKQIRNKKALDFPDLSPIRVVEDSVAHRSRIKTTYYLDGYWEQRGPNGISAPTAGFESWRRLRHIVRAFRSYIRDHNDRLPVYSSYDNLVPTLYPYVRASRSFQSPGILPFEVDISLSGTKYTDYPHPWEIIVFRDPNWYEDWGHLGGFLDGFPRPIYSN